MLKYCVWFPDFPDNNKYFTNKRKAMQFLKKQKVEVCLNNNVGTLEEDTIFAFNAPIF